MKNKEWTKQLIKKCLNKGADAAEVYLQRGRNLNLRIREGEVETVKENTTNGVGIRVFVKGKMAFAHCNDFSDSSVDQAIDSAVAFASNVTADKNNILPEDKKITQIGGLYDPEIVKMPMDKKIKMAIELEKLAIKDKRITKSAGSSFSEGDEEVIVTNSNGLSQSYQSSVCTLGVSVVAEKGDQKTSGGEYCSRRFFKDLKPLHEIADKAAEDAYKMLDPKMVKTQKAAVLFSPDVARAFLGGILGAINGERVLQGASFLRKSLGKEICSKLISIIDDGTMYGGLGSTPFDGEGVPTQKRMIVEKGILKGFMYNTITAQRAGLKSTGNASRRGFRGLPGIGAHNFYVEAGASSVEDIIQNTSKGLLLSGVTGYGINPVNGNFSGGASGFWIENGEIIFPVKGLTIAGTADQMLKSIDMVGNDLDLTRTMTAPTIRIPEIQIGGE